MKRIVCKKADIGRGSLILVNSANPLRNAGVSLIPLELASQETEKEGIYLERRAANLLTACIKAVGGERIIVPVSGWRSRREQQQIWDDTLKSDGEEFTRKYVALPDCSEHQTGLAIDLGRAAGHIDFIRPAFPYVGICGKFRRRAAAYGFIQRYEQGKEPLTGIAAEPWHFRYVGAPHAQLMQQNNLCLEEYVPFLRTGLKSCTLTEGRLAQVFYVPCQGETAEIELPEHCGNVQVSGDNMNGFIVTVWRDRI